VVQVEKQGVMKMNRQTKLSKTRFQSGLQCHKKLWLQIHDRDKATPIGPGQQGIFDQGTRVGEIARLRWPDGILVTEDYRHHQESVETTKKLLSDPGVTAIFEAGFEELGTQVRVDVLARSNGGDTWDIYEVKSSTSHKPEHDTDVAIQLLVLKEAGLNIRRKSLLLIDRSYEFGGDDIEPDELLYAVDVSPEVDELQSDIREQLEAQQLMTQLPDEPLVEPDRHCSKPYQCDFWDYCSRDKPEHWIFQLPGIRQTQLERWRGQGFEDFTRVPPSVKLNDRHSTISRSAQSGEAWVGEGLASTIGTLRYPIHYLDFETFNPAVPVYEYTNPYERVPFQWSCHIDAGDGQLSHEEYLADGMTDPREEFAETLLQALGESGSIVVYSSFEKSVLTGLAREYEDLQEGLQNIIYRLWDLMRVVRNNYYHPNFHGSISIKSVLPAVAPELDYSDLEIGDGTAASFAFQKRTEDVLSESEWQQTRLDLLKYCALDSRAMNRVVQVLQAEIGTQRDLS
jgi:hypothetical protein